MTSSLILHQAEINKFKWEKVYIYIWIQDIHTLHHFYWSLTLTSPIRFYRSSLLSEPSPPPSILHSELQNMTKSQKSRNLYIFWQHFIVLDLSIYSSKTVFYNYCQHHNFPLSPHPSISKLPPPLAQVAPLSSFTQLNLDVLQ